MLVVGAAASLLGLFTGDKRGAFLVLLMYRVVVTQGETLLEFLRQFALRVEGRQSGGAGLLPGAGVLVAGDVERVHRLVGEEEAVLAAFGHAPHHRGHPAAAAQAAQHSPNLVIGGFHDGRQVAHA